MKVSLITFADLGVKENLKTSDIAPLITELVRRDELEQIICRINRGFSFSNTRGALPYTWHYALSLLGRVPGFSFDARLAEETLFDARAERAIEEADVAVFHSEYLAPRTLRRAKSKGATTVGIATTAHPATNARLEEEEGRRLGILSTSNLHYHKRLARMDDSAVPDYLVVHSDFVRETYIRKGYSPERIFVAPLDIDTERFSPAPRRANEPFTVLYMGQSTILKGMEYLLVAWEALSLPGARLILSGGYSDMPSAVARRYNARIRSNPSIEWIPFTKQPETLYRRASVVVLPSLSEGFGRVTLEAMACGVPVITTTAAVGIIEDGVTGYIVEPRNTQAISEKIEYLFKERQVRENMARAAREAVLRKEPFARRVVDFLESLEKT
jgi:glycosyltransferase involved in cell wall biosynthesis